MLLLIILVKVHMILVLVMSNIPWVKTCPSAKEIHRRKSFHCQQIHLGNFTNFFKDIRPENITPFSSKFSVVFQILQAIITITENRSRSTSKPIFLTHPRGPFLLAKGQVMVLTGNISVSAEKQIFPSNRSIFKDSIDLVCTSFGYLYCKIQSRSNSMK